MAVKDRARKKQETNVASELLDAVKFIALVQRKQVEITRSYCVINNGYISASNGVLSAGITVSDSLSCCPNTIKFVTALSKCKNELSITENDNDTITVKSGPFKAVVQCVKISEMPLIYPDEALYNLNNDFTKALDICAPLASEKEDKVEMSSILLRSRSVIASNGFMLLNYWHGVDMPDNMVLPKVATDAIVKSGKTLAKFGFSKTSITFYFDDGSWIKSQLFDEEWTDISTLLDSPSNPWPVPDNFFIGLDHVLPFCDSESVYFKENSLASHEEETKATTYEVIGLPVGKIYSGKALKSLENIVDKFDFKTYDNRCMFFGLEGKLRGLLMGRVM